jgi:hypothetical protein
LAVYGVGYALLIVALAYFMKIRSEMRNTESRHLMANDEVFSQADETTQFQDKKRD